MVGEAVITRTISFHCLPEFTGQRRGDKGERMKAAVVLGLVLATLSAGAIQITEVNGFGPLRWDSPVNHWLDIVATDLGTTGSDNFTSGDLRAFAVSGNGKATLVVIDQVNLVTCLAELTLDGNLIKAWGFDNTGSRWVNLRVQSNQGRVSFIKSVPDAGWTLPLLGIGLACTRLFRR